MTGNGHPAATFRTAAGFCLASNGHDHRFKGSFTDISVDAMGSVNYFLRGRFGGFKWSTDGKSEASAHTGRFQNREENKSYGSRGEQRPAKKQKNECQSQRVITKS